MVVPSTIPLLSAPAIASYDHLDIEEGSGVVLYYALLTHDGSSQQGSLTTNADVGSHSAWTNQTAGGEFFNQNFDLEFKFPRLMKGKLIADVPQDYASGTNIKNNIAVTISHVDSDGNATQLATANVNTTQQTGSGLDLDEHHATLEFDDLDQVFKRNEKLRINVTVTGSGTAEHVVGHDPLGRTTTDSGGTITLTTTQMKFLVPFRLDI